MSRRHADQVEVQRGDEAPRQFLWRARLYLVREVLEHWTESSRWWRAVPARGLTTGEAARPAEPAEPTDPADPAGDLVLAPIPASPKWAQRAWGEPAPDVGASLGPASVDDGEREFWRVEAAAGRSGTRGVYDLCFDWSSGRWFLARVLD